jgi:two-component system response regulator YesN
MGGRPDMLKLMIADDEKWVRTTIKSIIPFGKLNLTLSCEAANGIEALELCRRHEPDILLTDIKMPGLTGLELIKEAQNALPDLKIIIISGYGDFEYAKTAMKYGITDYLLKPVDEKELEQVLERIGNEIAERERLKKEKDAEARQYKKAIPVMCESLLNQVISQNNMTSERIINELQKYNINFHNDSFTVIVTVPDLDIKSVDFRSTADYCRTVVKRLMKRYLKAITFPLEHDKTVLVSIINGFVDKEAAARAFRLGNRLLSKKRSLSVSAGVSGTTHKACMLNELYRHASEALEARFWRGAGTLAFHMPGNMPDDFNLSLAEETLNKIVLNIKLSNINTAISYVDSIMCSLNRNMRPELIKEFFWQLIQSVIILLNIQVPFIRHETVVTGEHPYDRIRGALFLESLEENVKDLLKHVFDFYHDKNPQVNENLVEKAKKIIEGNFAGDISLEQVARQVHLSPAYLSELFKRETGMSFIDYKTVVRIEQAKKLLMLPSANISDVSCKVGYSDPKYFSKLFKKITGKTILQYRKELRSSYK